METFKVSAEYFEIYACLLNELRLFKAHWVQNLVVCNCLFHVLESMEMFTTITVSSKEKNKRIRQSYLCPKNETDFSVDGSCILACNRLMQDQLLSHTFLESDQHHYQHHETNVLKKNAEKCLLGKRGV